MRRLDETIDYLKENDTHVPTVITVMALIGLGRIARLATLGMGALWVIDQIRHLDRKRFESKPSRRRMDRKVEIANEDSFPASDAPSYSSASVGAPDEVNTLADTAERPEHLH